MTRTIEVQAPPSKSLSHRAVITASLAVGQSRLHGVLESDDLQRTRECMQAAGARIERLGPGEYQVSGVNGTPAGGSVDTTGAVDIDVGESGTTCRLLTAVLAVGTGDFRIFGRGRMHERPIAELVDVLRSKGATVEYLEQEGCPPLLLRANGLLGGEVGIGMEESSQYLSGLLLAAPLARRPLTVAVTGERGVSWPYVGLTLATMERFGASTRLEVLDNGDWQPADWRGCKDVLPGRMRFHVPYGMYMGRELTVEGDWSNASYFLAAGAIGPRPVTVRNLAPESQQGDRAILDILKKMGAAVVWEQGAVTVMPSPLRGVGLDMGACPDLVPTVAVLAAFAQGETVITNVAHLKIKESDRLEGTAANLRQAGAEVQVLDDGLRIEPLLSNPDLSGTFSACDDHRMAMSAALFGLRQRRSVQLDNPGCVAKSFPGFWELWKTVTG